MTAANRATAPLVLSTGALLLAVIGFVLALTLAPAKQVAGAAGPARQATGSPPTAGGSPEFAPSEQDPNPADRIPGVRRVEYEGAQHVGPTERVPYDQSPPFGGPHDAYWAACNGVVYPQAVRTENMVHSLEHGAVWIAYDPGRVNGEALGALAGRVEGNPYLLMSPYPGLDKPVSLQSWGHQLKVDNAEDERIDQFIAALRQNPNTFPEIGASCDALGPGAFDPDAPPPFEPGPPPDERTPSATPPTGEPGPPIVGRPA